VVVGDLTIGGQEIIVAAGPCSVETREQIVATAESVRAHGARMSGARSSRGLAYELQGPKADGRKLSGGGR
jgi:3-deoxy-7-phosphoheptulonate synthase